MNFSDVKRWSIPEGIVYRVVDSNNRVIWERSGYFYVEDTTGQTNTLSITKSSATAPTIEVFRSIDTVNWTSMGTTDTTAITATIPAGGRLYLKAVTNRWCINSSGYHSNRIAASGSHSVGGNIMSLIFGDNYMTGTTISTYAFRSLFDGDTALADASQLLLPVNRLASECYAYMFRGCTSLAAAPELPAMTLSVGCYNRMFVSCTSLATAPELPAKKLYTSSYDGMFVNCTSLNRVITYAEDISESYCTFYWLDNVSATGDFYNLGGATYTSGSSGIPTGWTEHTSL